MLLLGLLWAALPPRRHRTARPPPTHPTPLSHTLSRAHTRTHTHTHTHPHPPTPQAYAFRALIPLHFYCEGSSCPTIAVLNPTTGATVPVDRWAFVESQYELSYQAVWPCIGITAIFVLVFQAANVVATYNIRHSSR